MTKEVEPGEKERGPGAWWIAPLVVMLVAIWLMSVPLLSCLEESYEAWGQVGDSFGAVNALFSGLALGGVVVAILLQGRELRLQREELRLQRRDLKDTREELKRQADAAESQREATLLSAAITAAAARYEGAVQGNQETENRLVRGVRQADTYRETVTILLDDALARLDLENVDKLVAARGAKGS